MIKFDNFCILHMPRCGGSFIRNSIQGSQQKEPGHEGWHYHEPFEGDVYGLIREPQSWYLSLHAYSMANNLIWKRAFGVGDDDDIQTAMRKWITASHAVDAEIDVPQIQPQNIYRQMRDMNIGLWSWWVLHMYGVGGGRVRDEKLAEDMTLLWLNNRKKDLSMLAKKYNCKTNHDLNPAVVHSRNASQHQEPIDIFDRELMRVLSEHDAVTLSRALLHTPIL